MKKTNTKNYKQSTMQFLHESESVDASHTLEEKGKVLSFEAYRHAQKKNLVKTFSPETYKEIFNRIEHLREM